MIFGSLSGYSQHYKAKFENKKEGYYQKVIKKSIKDFEEKKKEKSKRFNYDFSQIKIPNKKNLYTSAWHFNPLSQGSTGTCWDFSTTSFFESEIKRIHNKELKLSEMHTAYWEYVLKATRFINERGESLFAQGSEANAVTRVFAKYGAMPAEAYTGLKKEQRFHAHGKMFNEMKSYLESLKESNAWNLKQNIATIKAIMNHYMGTPPTNFTFNGKNYTAKEFFKKEVKLEMSDYIEVLSYRQKPYWQKVEYQVPDNWWHSEEYYNVPLDVYMEILKKSIREGYTMSIGGDISESGFGKWSQAAIIPEYDIPYKYINEDARQFRFSNHTTEDDHGMHLVGYVEDYNGDGFDWYLVKDSGSGSRNNNENAEEFGYYFFREDYVKLKIMDFTVHKDMIKKYLDKFKN